LYRTVGQPGLDVAKQAIGVGWRAGGQRGPACEPPCKSGWVREGTRPSMARIMEQCSCFGVRRPACGGWGQTRRKARNADDPARTEGHEASSASAINGERAHVSCWLCMPFAVRAVSDDSKTTLSRAPPARPGSMQAC
jgi:hypothetical protein